MYERGLAADEYANDDSSQIVAAIRGTVFNVSDGREHFNTTASDNRIETLSHVGADISFGETSPTPTLTRDVQDAAAFIRTVQVRYPRATVTLAGNSLGGAIAQHIGKASGLTTDVFNAPEQTTYSKIFRINLQGSPEIHNNRTQIVTGIYGY